MLKLGEPLGLSPWNTVQWEGTSESGSQGDPDQPAQGKMVSGRKGEELQDEWELVRLGYVWKGRWKGSYGMSGR